MKDKVSYLDVMATAEDSNAIKMCIKKLQKTFLGKIFDWVAQQFLMPFKGKTINNVSFDVFWMASLEMHICELAVHICLNLVSVNDIKTSRKVPCRQTDVRNMTFRYKGQ